MSWTQRNDAISFGSCQFADSNGNQHKTAMEAATAGYSTAVGQYTHEATGRVFATEKALEEYELKCKQQGYYD